MTEETQLELVFRNVYKKIYEDLQDLVKDYITSNEYVTMLHLLKGNKRVTELAKVMKISVSHISAVTDALVEKSLIQRNRSEEDRRVVEISLTSNGKELITKLNEDRKQLMHEKFQVFTEEERETLTRLLHKLEEVL